MTKVNGMTAREFAAHAEEVDLPEEVETTEPAPVANVDKVVAPAEATDAVHVPISAGVGGRFVINEAGQRVRVKE